MAQPDAYNRRKDFTANDGDETDHAALNSELDNAGRSINQLRDNLAQIQKDDGSLANQSVGSDQLKPEAFAAFMGGIDEAVREAKDASAESTRSATAAGEFEVQAGTHADDAARSASNAATSAASSAGAAQYLFNGIYLGPHAADPLVDGNGNPPGDGDFYYNTVAKSWRAYDAETQRWVAPILSGQYKRMVLTAADDDFEGGVTTTIALPSDPQTARNVFVHFDGIHQNDGTYSVAGLNLVFGEAIPVGVETIEIAYIEAVTIMVTDALMSFATRAIAAAAAAVIADGQAWEIRADEANGGKRSRGIVSAYALVTQVVEDFATNTALNTVAASRVAKNSDTGAMYVPEGTDAQRPAPEEIPSGVSAVRGNSTSLTDRFLEFWNRATNTWDAIASRKWVTDLIAKLFSPAITGIAVLTGADNKLVFAEVVTELGLEKGDVIRISGAGAVNEKLRTVESIVNSGELILNYEHCGARGKGSLKLSDYTGPVTITRIAKWHSAAEGLGQAWVDLTAFRSVNAPYTNSTGRTIISTGFGSTGGGIRVLVDGAKVASSTYNVSEGLSVTASVGTGSVYKFEVNLLLCMEKR